MTENNNGDDKFKNLIQGNQSLIPESKDDEWNSIKSAILSDSREHSSVKAKTPPNKNPWFVFAWPAGVLTAAIVTLFVLGPSLNNSLNSILNKSAQTVQKAAESEEALAAFLLNSDDYFFDDQDSDEDYLY